MQLLDLKHPRDDLVRSKCSTDGRQRQHNGWRPLIVGNQKNISLLVFYVSAWCYTDVPGDQAALEYYVL